jgi:hypothetical protein
MHIRLQSRFPFSALTIILQESKRVKFVFYAFVGSSANVMAKVPTSSSPLHEYV